MPMPSQIPITDFRNLSDTDKSLIVWQGLMDTWGKLMETIDHQKEIEADTKVHNKILVTGNGEPSMLERMRNIEKFVNTVLKLTWLFVGAIVVQITAFAVMAAWVVSRLYPILDRIATNP